MAFSISPSDKRDIAKTLGRRHKEFSWSEDFFANLIERNEAKMDVYWSVMALRDCGTARSIPSLKALATHPSQDIKATAMLTIARISRSAETEYYAMKLLDPSYRAKSYALWAIAAYGDERATDAVHQYVKKNHRKLAEPSIDARETYDIISYFYRTLGAAKAAQLFAGDYVSIRTSLAKSLSRLPAINRDRFAARYPEIDISLASSDA
ncbi:hypothetical protein OK348_12925 [Flavobacterium sp. MXW15]|jgi:hypothetical protein|uniref:HEAT repeat domain-containing protein n=1 Tax=Xanthomonas chitinilytica TaxID=2989819 RepID=A0ABT3JWJ8_9XANT|nr:MULTISPECIES: hypothetical protein [Xanthomonadaceae]MCW4455689.1 hypothetical protein [Flavobacterium sp. MXW15]MCW4472825.1 hypothetical protein [Xanthomonas sp. H13-6]